jgi:WD40 repeat protein
MSPEAQKQKDIFATIQSKFRTEQPAFYSIYKATKKDNSSDLLSMDEFSSLYKSLWIHLDRVELDLITAQFSSGIEGKLHWTKFVNRLNILPPADYSEPDRFLDPLPEPMNGIVEIIELDIIDNAWLHIIQLHPEIPIDDQGNSLVVRRNRNLEVLCAPSTSCRATTLPASAASDASCLFNAYEDGTVVVINTKSGEEQHSTPVFRDVVRSRGAPFSVILLSNAVTVLSANGAPVSRVAMCVLSEALAAADPAEAATAAAAAKKAPGKGKAAAVEEVAAPPAREFTLRVKLIETVESESGTRSIGLRVLTDELLCRVTSLAVALDLCSDGKLLTVCHTDRCHVYSVEGSAERAPLPVGQKAGQGLAQVPEEKPASSMDQEAPSLEFLLLAVLSIADYVLPESGAASAAGDGAGAGAAETPSADAAKNINFQKCISFLLTDLSPAKAAKKAAGDDSAPVKQVTSDPAAEAMNKYALIAVSDSSPVLTVVGFSPLPTAPVPAAAAPDKKGAPAPAPAEPAAADSGVLGTFLMNSWRLSGPVTALVADPSRRVLGVGTADGSVSLWDIPNRALISVCGKHANRVSALCFAEGVSNHIFCSGAEDGTVCFYSLRRGGGLQFEPATRLIDVRQDVPKAAVCCLYSLAETSIVICNFGDGTTAAYEGEAGDLLGRLVLHVGMLSQKMDSRPAPVLALMRLARRRHLHWLANALPSVDDGEMSDAGAGGGEGGEGGEEGEPGAESDPIEEFFGHTRGAVLSHPDSSGLCMYYSDVPKDPVAPSAPEAGAGAEGEGDAPPPEIDIIRATYTTDTIIESLFPGVATLRRGTDKSKIPSACALYRMLSVGERKNKDISSASIQYVDLSPATAATDADSSRTKKPPKPKKTSALTLENLNAHDNFDLIYKAPAPRLGPVQPSPALSRQNLGASLIKDLRQRPDAVRHNKKVTNRIKQLSNILPSS